MIKNLFTFIISFLFSLLVIMLVNQAAFAVTPVIGTIDDYNGISGEDKEKAKEIINNLKEQLSKLGITIDKKHIHLDDQSKEKVIEIFKNLHEGKISDEEAEAQLKEFGITLPKDNEFKNMDQETKEKVTSLVEDARSKLKDLGLKLPKKFERMIQRKE
ncbi:hypothetical protein [Ureibacillus acetophenoni]|uniref:Uncharacterized protein n=1 Tax=Ureibacillus acetophenoni TaxID=614649 RepID=A0A285U5J9_9BACL|nr:hypothetical protein [Ureibacillus acetophenoni]SOC37119.1 hypothetical protein SAMN05877842_10350 [Ureibacillus acetophenoni]